MKSAIGEQRDEVIKPSNPFDRAIRKFGDYFERQGLGTSDIPVAIVVHELLGLAIAAGVWAVI